MKKVYYYLDFDFINMKVIRYGEIEKATLTGDTNNSNIHRIFLTKGQYNKLINKIELCIK